MDGIIDQTIALLRYRIGSTVSGSGVGDLQEALQKVNADLEEANRELHDLREVWMILVWWQSALLCLWHIQLPVI